MDANERRLSAGKEAADWWARLHAEEISRAEREQFVIWLRESAVHVAEMLRVAQVHGALEHFENWTRIATGGAKENLGSVVELPGAAAVSASPAIMAQPATRRAWLGALAAAVGIAAIGLTLLLAGLFGQTIETERGERREVSLADGSVVQVDPETRLRVEFDDQARLMRLEHGRALFRVAKDPGRPFLVQAGDTVVRAVGTSFGIERQDHGVVVTVAEGRVAVVARPPANEPPGTVRASQRAPSSASGAGPAVPQPGEVFLDAGQQVTIQRSGSAEPVRQVDSNRELAWAQGRLVFENDDVATVIAEFNRYNRIQLQVTDTTLARRPISGVFDASDPESFIAFLRTVAPVRIYRGRDQDITIAPGEAR